MITPWIECNIPKDHAGFKVLFIFYPIHSTFTHWFRCYGRNVRDFKPYVNGQFEEIRVKRRAFISTPHDSDFCTRLVVPIPNAILPRYVQD